MDLLGVDEPNNYEARANLMWAGSPCIKRDLQSWSAQFLGLYTLCEHELSA